MTVLTEALLELKNKLNLQYIDLEFKYCTRRGRWSCKH
jgi:hypothetical protein